MSLTIYQVDAFTNKLFCGNPAAVVPLREWLDDELMQKIAMENNLSETVFFVKKEAFYEIRWFTPTVEMDLCGHATLASGFVLYTYLGYKDSKINFHSKSGLLTVERISDVFYLDFPSWKPERIDIYPEELREALGGVEIVGVYKHRDYLVELNNEEDVRKCNPDFTKINKTGENVMITAPGSGDIDFVSRFFGPASGVDEDPVTGSAHSQLIPFWAEKLNKKKMHAKQLSQRGGELWLGLWGDRVRIAGQCKFYMKGEIEIDDWR
jgi:predicted PhzF superfamily epimerase YddE/YHI9